MRKERFVINDRSWALIEPLLPGTARDRGTRPRTTGCFWKQCCGKYVLAVLGAIFLRASACSVSEPGGGAASLHRPMTGSNASILLI